jgi:hypothetical protein
MLFWLIRAELGQGHRLHKRFALILEAYARGVGNYLHTLLKQVDIVDRLDQVSILVKDIKEKDAATRVSKSYTSDVVVFEKFTRASINN